MPHPTRLLHPRPSMSIACLAGGVLMALGQGLAQAPPPATTPPPARAPLVLRNQVRLNLAGAELILRAAQAKARTLKVAEDIAVVDDGGHLLAFARMDGARPASAATALTKAAAAATMRQETGPVPPGAAPPDVLLNLSLQATAAAGGGKITALRGGVPVVVEGQIIGAVGVGGGTGEQDVQVARGGIDAFLTALKGNHSTR